MSDESGSVRQKAYNWEHRATISSATPLRHKDKQIPDETRERFERLDLEILLSEFEAVAAQSAGDEDEDGDTPEDEGAAETQWLENAGLGSLTDKIKSGQPISQEDIQKETQGLTASQVRAVEQRAELLNGTIRGSKKPTKPTAQSLFAAPAQPEIDETVLAKLSDLTDEEQEPPTRFQDLSLEDQQQVQCLNLIQLTSILEGHKQSMETAHHPPSKKKKKKRKPTDGVFGSTLTILCERDQAKAKDKMKHDCIPVFFYEVIDFLRKNGLKEEGIFRKAGAAARIKALRQQCEDLKGIVDFVKLDARAHDVSALLKQFLRDFAEPMLTSEYIEVFCATQQLESEEQRLYALRLLVMLLPPVNRACLKLLLDFLAEVASHSGVNKMGIPNLAVVFAPTLFFVHGQKGQKMLKEVEMQVTTASTLKTLIEYHDRLWEVPPDIVAQIRFVNESRMSGRKASRPKDVRRLLSKSGKGKSLIDANANPASGTVQWIAKAPPGGVLAKISVSMAGQLKEGIEVTGSTTAADVLAKVGAAPGAMLLESGGNIGLRRIAEASHIVPILRINRGLSLIVSSEFDCTV